MPMRTMPARHARRPSTRREFIQETLGVPGQYGSHGHGFTQHDLEAERAYEHFDVAEGIVGQMVGTTGRGGAGVVDPSR